MIEVLILSQKNMKKSFAILTLFLSVSLSFSQSYAVNYSDGSDKKEDVNIRDKGNPTRSLISLPIVYYCASISSISINFENSNSIYSVLVYDSLGMCVLSDVFIANGATQIFSISSFNPGLYTISIQNNNSEYEGEFILNNNY